MLESVWKWMGFAGQSHERFMLAGGPEPCWRLRRRHHAACKQYCQGEEEESAPRHRMTSCFKGKTVARTIRNQAGEPKDIALIPGRRERPDERSIRSLKSDSN